VREAKLEDLDPVAFTGDGRKKQLVDAVNARRAQLQPAGV
jgi:hypothetical protein